MCNLYFIVVDGRVYYNNCTYNNMSLYNLTIQNSNQSCEINVYEEKVQYLSVKCEAQAAFSFSIIAHLVMVIL